jgi:hypothetical protein
MILAGAAAFALAVAAPVKALEGGRAARNGEAPFAAFVMTPSASCTGAVIAPKVVLTAAHCVAGLGGPEAEVVTGAVDTSADNSFQGPADSIQIDPDFGGVDYNAHDVALIRLRFAVHVKQARLPGPADERLIGLGRTVTFAGWGQLTPQNQQTPNRLRIGKVQITRGNNCQHNVLDTTYTEEFDPQLWLCAQGRAQDCAGDSGGPWFANTRSGPVLLGTDENGECNPTGPGGRLFGYSMPTNLIGDVPWIVRAAHINAPPGTPPTPPRPSVTITQDPHDIGSVIVTAHNRPRHALFEVTLTMFTPNGRELQYAMTSNSSRIGAFRGYSLLTAAYLVKGEYGRIAYVRHY